MKLRLENSESMLMSELKKLSKIKEQFKNKSNSEKKILDSLKLLLECQKVAQKDLHLNFIGLANQNSVLLDLNKELNQRLEMVMSELNVIKKEREEKAARQKVGSNQKPFLKRNPINSEIYNLLVKKSEGPDYIATRRRVALCLLPVTGIRISELLPLKVAQLETLLEKGWISIDRLKKDPANHKAFLTLEGKKLVKA